MIKNLSYIFYKALFYLDKFFLFFTKRSFLIWFKDFIEEDSYKIINIFDKKILFFSPNQICNFRVDTFLSKEPRTLEWINNFQKEESLTFWDIGANIGLYSIYNAIKNPNSTTFSFEPSTSNLRILTKNISINNLEEKIKVVPIPLTNKENTFQIMNESGFVEGGALNTFGEDFNFEGKKFHPKTKYNLLGTTINYFIKNKIIEVPDYIKIDVDGIEHLILQAGNEVLNNKKVKSLNIEINENFEQQHKKVLSIMEEYNFRFIEKYNEIKNNKNNKNNKFSKSFNYIFLR
jgi:FkbM family methyltransferase